jgi:hypothetical protein
MLNDEVRAEGKSRSEPSRHERGLLNPLSIFRTSSRLSGANLVGTRLSMTASPRKSVVFSRNVNKKPWNVRQFRL